MILFVETHNMCLFLFTHYVIASVAWQSPTYRAALHIGDCHVVPPRNDAWTKTSSSKSFRKNQHHQRNQKNQRSFLLTLLA